MTNSIIRFQYTGHRFQRLKTSIISAFWFNPLKIWFTDLEMGFGKGDKSVLLDLLQLSVCISRSWSSGLAWSCNPLFTSLILPFLYLWKILFPPPPTSCLGISFVFKSVSLFYCCHKLPQTTWLQHYYVIVL